MQDPELLALVVCICFLCNNWEGLQEWAVEKNKLREEEITREQEKMMMK